MSSLSTVLLALLAAIVVLGPLIALHEWGHYIVARLCGVKVLTYSIGFGKKLFSWKSKKTGTDYCLSVIPLGGYVKMLDEREGEVPENERHLAFNNQHPLKKIAIVAAGPLMNFIIAIVLYWVLFMTPTEVYNTRIGVVLPDSPAAMVSIPKGDEIVAIDGHEVQTWEAINYQLANRMGETGKINLSIQPYQPKLSDTTDTQPAPIVTTYQIAVNNFMQGDAQGQDALTSLGVLPWQPMIEPVIGELSPDGAAIRQGLKVGDKITAINDQEVTNWIAATRIIKANPETLLNFTVERNGQLMSIAVMPQGKKDSMGKVYGQIGAGVVATDIVVPDDYKTLIAYDPATALTKSFAKTGQLTTMTLKSMGKMVSGMIGLENVSGPITIAKVAKQSFEISWEMVLSTAAIISLSLAVLNLLPIPVLDGGHIVYYSFELLRGKPLPENVQNVGFNIGLILLAGFMLLAISNDISRLF